jgi:hypothetical protein
MQAVFILNEAGIALSVLIYRSIGFSSFFTIAVDCGLLAGMVLFHHRFGRLVRLDIDSGESAGRADPSATLGGRQTNAIPDRIADSADYGWLAARRFAGADHSGTAAAAHRDATGDRQHPLCDGDSVGDGHRHLHSADRNLFLHFVRRIGSSRRQEDQTALIADQRVRALRSADILG